jgi:hypothetical protein
MVAFTQNPSRFRDIMVAGLNGIARPLLFAVDEVSHLLRFRTPPRVKGILAIVPRRCHEQLGSQPLKIFVKVPVSMLDLYLHSYATTPDVPMFHPAGQVTLQVMVGHRSYSCYFFLCCPQ